MLPLLVRTRFQVLFSLPLAGVLFAFPSRYWFTIGQSGVFSLGGWSPHIQTGYHVSRPTHRAHSMCIFVVRGCHPVSRAFPDASNTHTDSGSGLLPVRSPLLGESRLDFFPSGYLDVSVPPVRLINLWIQLMIVCRNTLGFPHSEIAGYNGSYHLTDAYRRLARPSSPLTARASTVYA